MKIFPLTLASALLIQGAAYADSQPDIREAIECISAHDIVKILGKFDSMKPEQRDTVDAFLLSKFVVKSGALPDRIFTRAAGEDINFTLTADGRVPDLSDITKRPKDAELCVEDQARAGLSRDEDGLEFHLEFDVRYKNVSGIHTLTELRDGAKDGKSFYKKIVPGPIKLLVPSMTHVSVSFDKETASSGKISANKDGEILNGLIIEPFGESLLVSLKQLESLGADSLAVSGSAYKLEPSPSIKKLRQLGFDEDDAKDPEENQDK